MKLTTELSSRIINENSTLQIDQSTIKLSVNKDVVTCIMDSGSDHSINLNNRQE